MSYYKNSNSVFHCIYGCNIVLLFFVYKFNYFYSNQKINSIMTKEKNKIFTLLKYPLTGYLDLCLQTWKKYTPDSYEIIFLTLENFYEYIDSSLLNLLNLKNLRKPEFNNFSNLVCDCISTAVLYCNGGIFLDTDTIMTNKFRTSDILLKKYELIVYGNCAKRICPGFIMAQKNSGILEELLRQLSFYMYLPENDNYKRTDALTALIKESPNEKIIILDCENQGYYAEKAMYGIFNSYLYKKYYFSDIGTVQDFLSVTKGISALHNSMTPDEYKKMTKEEFLNQNILLSKIFKTLL